MSIKKKIDQILSKGKKAGKVFIKNLKVESPEMLLVSLVLATWFWWYVRTQIS